MPIERGADATRKLKGVVSIHAGAKSNSIEEIKNYEQFQQRIKYDITKQWVDLMEVGQLKDIDNHLKIIFPQTGLDKPLIVCSDSHKISQYSVKAPMWFRADPTFRGLLMILREPRDRIYVGDRPPEIVRVEQNPTKYVRRLSFKRGPTTLASEKWFSGSIEFSSGLVAIIGNKGNGKSALSDTLGLLGATKNAESFSFLCKDRFRHPTAGRAADFEAVLEWESGEKVTVCLADNRKPEEVERVKYLPQDHVETVCNELVGIGEEGFERELKSVIFSHVPEVHRLGHATLDELVRFRAGEKQRRIDSLLKQLREVSRSRALLESQTDPTVEREVLEKIKRRELELEAHDRAKPQGKENPASSPAVSAPDPVLIAELTKAESEKTIIDGSIKSAEAELRVAERRHAVAKLLLEKFDNFAKEFDVFKRSLNDDAAELGLVVENVVSLSINDVTAITIRNESATSIFSITESLDGDEPPGLRKQIVEIEVKIAELQSKLDAPNRAYQTYLRELAEWQGRRAKLEGDAADPESLKGLQAILASLDQLPQKIGDLQAAQNDLAIQIHAEKLAQAEVYRELYGSVQQFIDTHSLAKDKLKLEFRAELVNENFSTRLLNLLALNRRGSFMGIDEGRARADALVETTDWQDSNSVRSFLNNVDTALHVDQRDNAGASVQLKDQLSRATRPEEVFDLLYGLEYIRPRYILRWEGKDLSMLSPGERGTLLLVFYLLIDKGDTPLIIDQPEGNLDNHTVAKVLVDCIKEARKKRQVFIVTHNPNLAVVCDADQVVHANMDKANGNAITYTSGLLENPVMSKYVTDVLEGTRWAFDVRDSKYEVGESE